VSPATAVRLHGIDLPDPWDFQSVYAALHDVARSYRFEPDREDYLVHITTGSHVSQICLFLLTEARWFPARLVQTAPPARGVAGPGTATVVDLDLSRYDRLASRFADARLETVSFLKSGIRTRNAAFNLLVETIERVALAATAPILLTGPTGSGKSRLARKIFEIKKARHQIDGILVEVNCATMRGDPCMSALFGHVKGAFTGAVQDRPGLLRSAHRGVLFLDEIGELGLDEQAMLLRALEERRFLPVGSDREVTSEFQLIAGTNRSLPSLIREGRFRDDLLARIDLWTFELPGLAGRPEDLEPNLDYELEELARTLGHRVTMSREARERFLEFGTSPAAVWPGNFRDLNAAVTRMATLAAGGRISPGLVADEIARLERAWGGPRDRQDLVEPLLGRNAAASLDRYERVQLEEVVRVCRGSRSLSEAGRALFGSSRERKRSVNDADRLRARVRNDIKAASELAGIEAAEKVALATVAAGRRARAEELETQRQASAIESESARLRNKLEQEKLEASEPVALLTIGSKQRLLREEIELRRVEQEVKRLEVAIDLTRRKARQDLRREILPLEQTPEIARALSGILGGAQISMIGGESSPLLAQLAPLLAYLRALLTRTTAREGEPPPG
jgi:transcriptional regulatory protein RtcR